MPKQQSEQDSTGIIDHTAASNVACFLEALDENGGYVDGTLSVFDEMGDKITLSLSYDHDQGCHHVTSFRI
jgi:hypothetical protein